MLNFNMLFLNLLGDPIMALNRYTLSIAASIFAFSSLFISCGSGGGSSSSGNNPDPQNNSDTYADIYNPSGQHLSTDRIPSQFVEGADLPVCQTGETFALDECWQKLIINADKGYISVENTTGEVQKIYTVNGEINSKLQNFYNLKIASSYYNNTCDTSTSMYNECYDTYANKGSPSQYFQIPYLADAGVTVPRVSFRSISGEWSTSSLPEVTPWATSNEITLNTNSNKTISFGVKTTFAYGLLATNSNLINTYKIAHYWDLNGVLIINSKSYNLPLKFSELEKDMQLENIGTPTGYMDSKRIKIGNSYIIFYPESNSKYGYSEFMKDSPSTITDKIKGIVFSPSWDTQNF